ncbi:MAG TPA: hypothetical protein VF656_06470 [Pyrinomonadaceae bacterium]|jgi:predicted nuclease with TOPRIM domain
MSEDLTRNLPTSFQERVLAEFAALNVRFTKLDDRMTAIEDRMTSFEGRMSSFEGRMSSLEGYVIALDSRMTSLEGRMISLGDRVLSIDTRLTSLEEKVDARLRETRPIWEGVQQRLTEIEKGLATLGHHFKTMVNEEFKLRSRVDKLEDELYSA